MCAVDLLAQMLGVDFSIGAILQVHAKMAAALAAPVVHMDEMNHPREGTTSVHWVWGVVQPRLAIFSIGPSRARYETCPRQERDRLDYLCSAIVAWIDKSAPPSLTP